MAAGLRSDTDPHGHRNPVKSRSATDNATNARPTDRKAGGHRKPKASIRPGWTGWVQAMLNKPLASFHLVLASSALLLSLGLMMVLSSSSVYAYRNHGDAYYYVKRQAVFLIVGVVGAVAITKFSPSVIRFLAWAGLFVSTALLILTYTPLGITINGNRNWLQLGAPALQLQPSEFAKLALIIWAADVLARKQALLERPKHLLFPFLPVALILILLVVFQGDAGTSVVMSGIVAGVLWIVGAPLRIFATLGLLGCAGIAGLIVTTPYRMARMLAFLKPGSDASGINLQSDVAMHAVASGGWWGFGLGASRQKWGNLPEVHTDFIFAVIGEELGLLGSLVVLALFVVLGYAGLRIALRSDQMFGRNVAAGVTAWFMVQALINLAVVLRLLPIAGVPLPLVSYGGSALIANLLAIGFLLAAARNEPAARRVLSRAMRRPKPQMTTVVQSRGAGRRGDAGSQPGSQPRRRRSRDPKA
jgi:cell division protein FtsW